MRTFFPHACESNFFSRRNTIYRFNIISNMLFYSSRGASIIIIINLFRTRKRLKDEFKGQIWLEVMLVKGVNDADDELEAIGEKVKKINPDRVYVMVPSRPPAEKWVRPPSPETIIKAQKILTGAVALEERETGEFGLEEFEGANDAILGIGTRHPLRYEQALKIEQSFSETGEVKRMLDKNELVIVKFDDVEYVLPGFFRRG